MDNVINLGTRAFLKFGAENVTLFQLCQAEQDGLFCDAVDKIEDCQVICIREWTQNRHSA